MSKGQQKRNTDQVVSQFRTKHGDYYDYSKVEFVNSHQKVTIICPKHGAFEQTPAIHLRGSECKECGNAKRGSKRRDSTESFIEKARVVHGNRYDYTPTVYGTSRTQLTINCHIHGAFEMLPGNHLKGQGCRVCGLSSERQLTGFDPTEEFRAVHGDRYDYSRFVYNGANVPGTIICPAHGPFEQSYYTHKTNHGCPECGKDRGAEARSYTQEEIIAKFHEVHGDRYDYSRVLYQGPREDVIIRCAVHGEFTQTPYSHFSGTGCPKCSATERGLQVRKSMDHFIDGCRIRNGDLYDYSVIDYQGMNRSITLTCQKHGQFDVLAKTHYHDGTGCPTCSHAGTSRAETDIGDYIESLGLPVIRNTRKLIAPKEIDIYVEERGLAIEYCGLYWHGERGGKDSLYHRDKQLTLGDQGIELVTIFEDEWLDRSDVVKSILRTKLGLAEFGPGARHLRLEPITHAVSAEFLNLHHIQGAATGSLHLGAWHNGLLVGVMVFGEPTRQTSLYQWELKRFSTDGRIYSGMMSKMFNWFVKEMRPESVVSFSDNRWFAGGSYQKIGFTKDAEIPPDYYYTRGGLRYHKSRFRKSGIKRMHPEFYDDALTERVMMEQIGYDRVWDCGKIRWVWTPI